MRALVTFALDNEFDPWRRSRRFQRVTGAWDRMYAARVGSVDVNVVLTGAGQFAAQRAIAQALQVKPEIVVASGLAGALKPGYSIGQILVARGIANPEGTRFVVSDPELVVDAEYVGATRVEKFLVSDRVISTAAEKKELAAHGDAVDMESIHVLAAAAHARIPAVAIRSVSDDAETDLPLDFDRVFNDRGMVSLPNVIGQAMRKPQRIKGLLQLARHSERASKALAAFLNRFFENITEGPYEDAKADALAI